METKVCKKCGIEKPLTEFGKNYNKQYNKYYIRTECKECHNIFIYKYRKNHIEKVKESEKKYQDLHKEQRYSQYKKWRAKNKDYVNFKKRIYEKKRRDNDINYKLKTNIRNLIAYCFKNKGYKKHTKTEQILGCDCDFFCNYLLKTFKDNYGYDYNFEEPTCIDHIIPISKAKTKEEIIRLCHYTNLQLLKVEDNLKKSNKLNWEL